MAPLTPPKAEPSPTLELTKLSARRAQHLVLSQVDLRLERGQLLGVIGPNGAGKSSLLEVLAGGLEPSSGQIWVDGHELARQSARQRADYLGLTGRETHALLPLTVEELVELGLRSRSGTQSLKHGVEQALDDAEASELRHRKLHSLSQGELQRAHLARLFAQAPRLFLLDEATAHLDLSHRELVLSRVKQFCQKGHSALCVVHDLDIAARLCDQLLILDAGQVIAQGPPLDVLSPRVLRETFQVDAELRQDERGVHLRVYGRGKPSPISATPFEPSAGTAPDSPPSKSGSPGPTQAHD